MKTNTKLKVWKIIKIGNYKNVYQLREALNRDYFQTSGRVIDILINNILKRKPVFTLVAAEEKIELINVSVADLGFKNGATYKDICAKIKEFGLKLCPNEVGPQLRLQYKDQPENEWLNIGMEPIPDWDAYLSIFHVGCDNYGDLWLDKSYGEYDRFYNANKRFVFCLRK